MEGVGSRLGRTSSRYGPATVFNGPVRKWKKKWVQVSSSNVTYQNSQSQSNGHNNNGPRLLLCRWTPISPSSSAGYGDGDNSSGVPDEPPRRKFRYSPIVTLEKQKKEVTEKVDDDAKINETNQSTARPTSKTDGLYGKPNIIDASIKETKASNRNPFAPQDSNIGHLDLGLCTEHSDIQDSVSQNKEGQLERVSSGGFWAMG